MRIELQRWHLIAAVALLIPLAYCAFIHETVHESEETYTATYHKRWVERDEGNVPVAPRVVSVRRMTK